MRPKNINISEKFCGSVVFRLEKIAFFKYYIIFFGVCQVFSFYLGCTLGPLCLGSNFGKNMVGEEGHWIHEKIAYGEFSWVKRSRATGPIIAHLAAFVNPIFKKIFWHKFTGNYFLGIFFHFQFIPCQKM